MRSVVVFWKNQKKSFERYYTKELKNLAPYFVRESSLFWKQRTAAMGMNFEKGSLTLIWKNKKGVDLVSDFSTSNTHTHTLTSKNTHTHVSSFVAFECCISTWEKDSRGGRKNFCSRLPFPSGFTVKSSGRRFGSASLFILSSIVELQKF